MDCKCQIYKKIPLKGISGNLENIFHCICENCGNEWVE